MILSENRYPLFGIMHKRHSGRNAMPRPSVAEKRATFRKLHESGCWMIPNPWDVGSARYLQGLGFKALA